LEASKGGWKQLGIMQKQIEKERAGWGDIPSNSIPSNGIPANSISSNSKHPLKQATLQANV